MASSKMPSSRKQRGVVLLVGLLMLILLTLMAVAAIKFSTGNFNVVFNQQLKQEATRSAEQVIEQIINNPSIDLTDGDNLFGTGTNELDLDITGDGIGDYTVSVSVPECVRRRIIPATELNLDIDDDLACSAGEDQTIKGVEGAGSSDSLCAEVVFDVTATASDSFQRVNTAVVQGIGQRIGTTKVSVVCD